MPRTAHRVVGQDPVAERPAIMRAGRADGEDLAAAAGEQHILFADMPHEHLAVGKLAGGNTRGQIGAGR